MVKAYKVIDSMLNCDCDCGYDGEEDTIFVACLDLLVSDLVELFNLFAKKLTWILNEYNKGIFCEGWDEVEVRSTLKFFTDYYHNKIEEVEEFVNYTCSTLEVSPVLLSFGNTCV